MDFINRITNHFLNYRYIFWLYFEPRWRSQSRFVPQDWSPSLRIVASILSMIADSIPLGQDYLTADSTGVCDYIHVMDPATGHVAAIKYLKKISVCLLLTWVLGEVIGCLMY
jgi:UDP-glucose 4-epimerase